MNENNSENKKINVLKSIIIVLGIGLIQGGICGISGLLLSLINEYAIFGVVVLWLIFGWITTYIIKIHTMEILTVLISGNILFFIILYISGIRIWFIFMILGVSILFWGISFITKLMLYPKTSSEKTINEELNEK
ncbi:MAG: hypothetical protein FK731_03160 [Asgard group archaeon]|nr:hypothetical protein [Asgard group archaeon]